MHRLSCFRFLLTPTVFAVAVVLLGVGGIDNSLSAKDGGASAQEWSVPVNLGPVVNSGSKRICLTSQRMGSAFTSSQTASRFVREF